MSEIGMISLELGLRGQEEEWFGLGKVWAFTRMVPGLAQGCTFYVAPGSDLAAVRRRWEEKLAEYLSCNAAMVEGVAA